MQFISALTRQVGHRLQRITLRQLLLTVLIPMLPATLHAQVLSFAGLQRTLLPNTGLTAPVAVAIDAAGNRYIINKNSANIIEVSAAGVQSLITVNLTNPYAIAVDSSANLYVADFASTHIIKVPAGGGTATSVGSGLLHPTGVAVDNSDDVYIADSGHGQVVRIAASNSAQTNVSSGSFTTPVGVAVNANNTLYVSDIGSQNVYQVTFSGALPSVSTALTGVTDLPYDVSADSAGDIFLSGGTSHLLMMYGVNGTVRQLGTGLSNATGTALDIAGDVYVADEALAAVAIIDPGSIDLGQVNLCPLSGTQTNPCSVNVTLNFNVAASQTLTAVSAIVATQGGQNLDFTESNNTCTGVLTGPSSCSIAATFKPLAPGARLGAVDVSGVVGSASTSTLLSTVAVHGVGIGPLAGFDAGVISSLPITLGGTPYLSGAIADGAGNLYFVDNGACIVEKFTVATAATTVVAGSGTCGPSTGDGGPATSAVMTDPWRLALDGRGDLYIADDQAEAIRKVDLSTGIITTIAGTLGTAGYSQDGVVAQGAPLDRPFALAVDGAGDIYFADYADETVRRIDAVSGILTTVAGNRNQGHGYSGDGGLATSAQLDFPIGIALDSAGNLYIADDHNSVIREVTLSTGIITTVAGTPLTAGYSGDGGAATAAELNDPEGLALDAAGNLYIADSANYAVRKVSAATGLITTVAGVYSATPTKQNSGDGGPANLAGLSYVQDVSLDGSGNFYIVDSDDSLIREVTQASGIATFGTANIGSSTAAIDVAVTNNGNAALDVSALAPGTNFDLGGTDTSCTATTTLSAGASCILGVEFMPTAAGTLTGSLTVTDNVGNDLTSTQSIAVSGIGAYVPTQIVLAAIPATLTAGGNLGSVQASVESSGGSVVTTSSASVTATITGPANYSQAVTAAGVNGIATLNLSSLVLPTPGVYTVTASSTGLTSSTATVTVLAAASQLSISGIPSTLIAGGNLGMATVTVEASDGSVITGSSAAVTINIAGPGSYSQTVTTTATSGVATLDLSSLALATAGTYTVTASSSGLPNATASVTVVTLDYAVAATGSTTATVAAGASATYSFTLTPTQGTFAQAIVLSATGLPSGATATFSPATVTPGAAAATSTLTIQTAAATAALHPMQGISNGLGGIALALMLLPFAAARRLRNLARRMPMMALAAGLLSLGAVCSLTGCGGGSSAAKPQTYTITVTGTSGALSHSTSVTLIVQ